jgi:hypothetical protein
MPFRYDGRLRAMGEKEHIETAKVLLDGLTSDDLRVVAVEALRSWRRSSPSSVEFSMHGDFGRALVPLLAAKNGVPADPQFVKEPFLYQQAEPWMRAVADFTSWIVRAGLAIPLYRGQGRENGYASSYRLTTAGERILDATGDHPFLPGFLERIGQRCAGLPDEVFAHLVDAQACLDHGLGRPAVVLTGLAYEAAENAAIEHLEKNRGLLLKKGAKAAERIAATTKLIPNLFGGDPERAGRALAAWDFADRLRERRNHASHPKAYPDFSDLAEIHEFIVSAGRHLPGLWSVNV